MGSIPNSPGRGKSWCSGQAERAAALPAAHLSHSSGVLQGAGWVGTILPLNCVCQPLSCCHGSVFEGWAFLAVEAVRAGLGLRLGWGRGPRQGGSCVLLCRSSSSRNVAAWAPLCPAAWGPSDKEKIHQKSKQTVWEWECSDSPPCECSCPCR